MCSRCSGLSLFHTCARSCNSCRCAGGRFCSRRLLSRTFCFSCGLRLLNSLLSGGVYADGGRFELKLGRVAVSARFMFAFGGRFAPEFCRSFCARRVSCCCCCSRLCSSLCCCLAGFSPGGRFPDDSSLSLFAALLSFPFSPNFLPD